MTVIKISVETKKEKHEINLDLDEGGDLIRVLEAFKGAVALENSMTTLRNIARGK